MQFPQTQNLNMVIGKKILNISQINQNKCFGLGWHGLKHSSLLNGIRNVRPGVILMSGGLSGDVVQVPPAARVPYRLDNMAYE